MKRILLFSVSPGWDLPGQVASLLGITLSPLRVRRFACGELLLEPLVSARGADTYIFVSTPGDIHDQIFRTLILSDSLGRSGAHSITVVLGYFPYSRQDKRVNREPLTASLMARLFEASGVDRILTVDLHSRQVEGFFEIAVENLDPTYPIASHLRAHGDMTNLVVVSPDAGGMGRAKSLAKLLNLDTLSLSKFRENDSCVVSETTQNLSGKICLIYDDILDGGSTILGAANSLRSAGASEVMIVVTHALFSGDAVGKFREALSSGLISALYATDMVELPGELPMRIIPMGDFIARAIGALFRDESLMDIYASYGEG